MARKVKYLVVHHNGVPGRTIQDIRRTHVIQNGWRDIGYHWVFHEDGTEHPGRPESTPGAHVTGLNMESVGYCVVGNGNEHDFNPAQYRTLVARLASACTHYGLDADSVIGHRETAWLVKPEQATKKTCPGTKVDMNRLRTRVHEELRLRREAAETGIRHG